MLLFQKNEPEDMIYPEYYQEIIDDEESEYFEGNSIMQWFLRLNLLTEIDEVTADMLVMAKSEKKVNEVIGTTRTAVMFVKNTQEIVIKEV